jgi:HSP20 family protein
MAQLTQWIPDNWRQALTHLRDEIHDVLDRWLHRQRVTTETRNDKIVPRHAELDMRGGVFWSPSLFMMGGPEVDIDETDDELFITAELPGLERDDFTVEVTGDRLVIRGEKKQSSTRNGYGYTYTERRYGAFARTLWLPCEVEVDKARATYKHGVLQITLPKTARAKAARVKVRVR